MRNRDRRIEVEPQIKSGKRGCDEKRKKKIG